MDEETIWRIRELNIAFYHDNHASFSSSRRSAWEGWKRVGALLAGEGAMRILDVACGNMRFERFMGERYPELPFRFDCIDSCPELAEPVAAASFQSVDVIEALLRGEDPIKTDVCYEGAVCFGFMHHVPSAELRVKLACAIVDSLMPGGLVAFSFWRFHHDAGLKAKAAKSTRTGCEATGLSLESGDYLLGWNNEPGVYRYCHSFEDVEIDSIVEAIGTVARPVERFYADGRTGALNAYVVLRRS